mgnify:FL=1|jgi:hypothetical protein
MSNIFNITINCDSADEARVYLNAPQYHNLLSDLYHSARTCQKHGDGNLDVVLNNFLSEICNAVDNSTGAY